MTREEYINILEIDKAELTKENQELKQINEEHKKLNGDLRKENKEIRLDQTKKVFHVLTHVLLNGGCTYRYLIYDLLGFELENYSDLIEGMNIVNAIATLEELKKQLENYKKLGFKHLQDKNNNLETQQKEFIKYLEDEIRLYENDIQNFKKDYKVYFSLINDLRVSKAKIEEILQKYKEIMGGK